MFNQNISYTFKHHPRARHVRIAVKHDGEVIVTVPRFISKIVANEFVNSHLDWIRSKQEKFKNNPPTIGLRKATKEDYLKNKEAARVFISDRLKVVNQFYGFAYKKVFIKNSKTRWGSCSKKGNLNFNYKILFLPIHLADYVVAHELCHLKELNHSAKFWQLVEHSTPNWRVYRRELRQNIF